MRRAITGTVAAVAMFAAACSADDGTGTRAITRRAVVHAVLDPLAPTQVVLVERSLLEPRDAPYPGAYDPGEMVLGHGGDPVRGARVVLYDAAGDSAVALEDASRRADGIGAGVYRVATRGVSGAGGGLPSIAIVPGATYRLRVETDLGVVRGSTRVPAVAAAPADTLRVKHDVTRFEAQVLPLPAPTTAWRLFSVSSDATRPTVVEGALALHLIGDRLHAYADRIFNYPLSTCDAATVNVSAVDANYATFSRAGNRDNLHGDDLRTAGVTGGSGVFGAIAPHAVFRIEAFSSSTGALDGRWRADGTMATDLLDGATMCLFTPGPSQPGAVDGSWALRPDGPAGFVYGGMTSQANRVVLTLAWPGAAVSDVNLDGTVRGDTIDARDTRSGQRIRFVRDAAP